MLLIYGHPQREDFAEKPANRIHRFWVAMRHVIFICREWAR